MYVIVKKVSYAKLLLRNVNRKRTRIFKWLASLSSVKLIALVVVFTTLGVLFLKNDVVEKHSYNELYNKKPETKLEIELGKRLQKSSRQFITRIDNGRKTTREGSFKEIFRTQNLKINTWSMHAVNNQRIFFHETSGRSRLTFRQCCAVESVAKNNPTRPVHVYLSVDTVDIDELKACFNVLNNYVNVEIFFVNNEEYFKGSPLEEWYNAGEWRSSDYKVTHISDFIRLVSLLRGGGLYLDIDYIIMKELPEKKFTNFLVIEGIDGKLLNNGVMHFNSSHRLVYAWAEFIAKNYDPEDYYLHGPTALSHVYRELCKQGNHEDEKKHCPDVKLVTYKYFCPVGAPFWELIFKDATDLTIAMVKNSFGIHLWNSLSSKKQILVGSKQLYALVAQENCPYSVDLRKEFRVI